MGDALQPLDTLEAWFVTGSQTMYGEASLQTVSEHAARLAEVLDGLASIPVRIVQRLAELLGWRGPEPSPAAEA